EGAAQLRRPGGGCAWRGPPLRSRVELRRHGALSAPAPGGVGPRGTAQGSAGSPAPGGVGPRGTAQGNGGSPAPRGVGPRGTAQGSGEGSPAPRGVGPRGTAQGSGEGASSIDPRGLGGANTSSSVML